MVGGVGEATTPIRSAAAPEDLPDVVAAFSVLTRVAEPLMKFALPEDLVAAAAFVPEAETRE